ncbi:MAG: threonine synthase [Acidimicrobiales bacterium]|nr:MAG: threonine synthase [Acidimicrobiales bacterium]
MATSWRGVIEEFRDQLPVTTDTPVITLCEGGTPLLYAPHLSELTGAQVYLKVEGANPTGSFKDRGMTLAVSKAVEAGSQALVCSSTGNTAASAAAYATRAGLTCAVLLPRAAVAAGKVAQALAFGATLLEVEGSVDDCLVLATQLSEKYSVTLVNSVNPYRIAGQRTAALEVVEQLGTAPAAHFLPVGGAGNITAYWAGYRQAHELGWSTRLPMMCGFQAAGAAPIVRDELVVNPQTVASAIRIGNPASWSSAVAARDESGGLIAAVSDEQILAAHRLLSSVEAVFVEPASAAGVAGLLAVAEASGATAERLRGHSVVCTVTGNGLKDPEWAVRAAPPSVVIAADVQLAANVLTLH